MVTAANPPPLQKKAILTTESARHHLRADDVVGFAGATTCPATFSFLLSLLPPLISFLPFHTPYSASPFHSRSSGVERARARGAARRGLEPGISSTVHLRLLSPPRLFSSYILPSTPLSPSFSTIVLQSALRSFFHLAPRFLVFSALSIDLTNATLHRFLRMSSVGLTSSISPTSAPHLSPSQSRCRRDRQNGAYMQADVPFAELDRDVMDAAFVKAVVPIDKTVHPSGDSVELGVAWGYKYLLDLDGMGYSGRFMAFLASDSVPVKSTVYDEYFSDWIEPWVHYIPFSTTYTEIYNIVAFFSGPSPATLRAANLSVPSASSPTSVSSASTAHDGEKRSPGEKREQHVMAAIVPESLKPPAQIEGDRRLRRISRAGKQWKQTIGRTVDMEVYVYCLALEYARLWVDDREAMSYEG
ncbi:hypothetical protein C8J57DRAFT_1504793 [Mycena rebaudengoi]|nr:hypothetical protein C8J57DRAFT_1504793 [Mycena rebaudengoi]